MNEFDRDDYLIRILKNTSTYMTMNTVFISFENIARDLSIFFKWEKHIAKIVIKILSTNEPNQKIRVYISYSHFC
jgi:hypothetical protein